MLLAEPVVLENPHVRLEPLDEEHASELATAATDLADAWYTSVPTPARVPDEIERRLALRDGGTMNPWAIRRLDTGAAIGMTTFCNINQPNRHVEIGYTWISRAAQRTAINSATKHALLTHAFEACDAIAVEFCTHFHNRQSRAAIERLGAKQDGIRRNHRIDAEGALRDTVVYSILPAEWPTVRRGLDAALRREPS